MSTSLTCLAVLLILLYIHIHVHTLPVPIHIQKRSLRHVFIYVYATTIRIHIHIDTFESTVICIITPRYVPLRTEELIASRTCFHFFHWLLVTLVSSWNEPMIFAVSINFSFPLGSTGNGLIRLKTKSIPAKFIRYGSRVSGTIQYKSYLTWTSLETSEKDGNISLILIRTLTCYNDKYILLSRCLIHLVAQLTGAVEYTNSISAEG